MCSCLQLVLRGGNIKGLIVMEALVSDLKVPAGIRAGKVLTTGLSAVTTLLYQEGKQSFLSSLLLLVLSRQGARERLSAWQNTQVQL